MFSSYFKTAFRSLWRKKSFSVLNILGLSVGIAASLLIFLVIRNELSYDTWHKKANRIFRVTGTKTLQSNGEITDYLPGVVTPLPDAMRQDFPQLKKVAAMRSLGQAQIYVPGKDLQDEKRFKENDGLFWTEPGIFDIFDYTWMAGNAAGMKDPHTVVLDQSTAEKYFGTSANALGKTIQLWSFRIPLRVVGIFKDLPANTDIPIKLAASDATLRTLIPENFTNPDFWFGSNDNNNCFVLLPAGQSASQLQPQLASFVQKHFRDKEDQAHKNTHLALQPLKNMHLDSHYSTFRNNAISVKELWALALIGIFLLLVACINFINLSTAQAVTRAKEIGVRKVLGSDRAQLRNQFLKETAFITFLSILLGCILAFATVPLLNSFMNKGLSLNLLLPANLLFLIVTGGMVTLLAGFYPAVVLSAFNPAMIFKNKINLQVVGGISLRRVLVVFQFVIAQLLVIGTIVVMKQMNYFRNRPMGFNKENIVMINLPSDSALKVKYPLLVSRMLQLPGISSASLCMEAPSNFWSYQSSFSFDNEAEKKKFEITRLFADTGYYKTFGLELAAGRLPFHSDTTRELVVNETAVKKLGFASARDILGKTMTFYDNRKIPIVGVVKDFNNKSLREAISPLVISSEYGTYEWIAIRTGTNNMKATLGKAQKVFTNLYPTYMYDQVFFDQRMQWFYTAETVTAKLFKAFAFLAIFISCLGLYGLVSFMALQKTKEVGIRKVLGASVRNILYLFSKEFTILIGLAFLIAAPIGYYFMQQWLSGFYYHTAMGWEVFVVAIILSVLIAWITVGYKALKAALANPVKALKSE